MNGFIRYHKSQVFITIAQNTLYTLHLPYPSLYYLCTYDLYEVHLIDKTLGTCIMYQSKGTLPQKSFLILATDLEWPNGRKRLCKHSLYGGVRFPSKERILTRWGLTNLKCATYLEVPTAYLPTCRYM